jgi:hypothetical protein
MNKRLNELRKLARKEVWGNNQYNGAPEFEGWDLDAEKFAELIIKECIDYCGENLSKTVGDALKIHFGVKND